MIFTQHLYISLATGSSKAEEKYDTHEAAKWGIWSWLTIGGYHLHVTKPNQLEREREREREHNAIGDEVQPGDQEGFDSVILANALDVGHFGYR